VAGAALDVLEEERVVEDELELLLLNRIEQGKQRVLLENHALMNMPNVLLTPHIAFNTRETVEETWKVTAQNIQRFLDGKPQNLVGE
jgi:D-lactate dehydrogenase